MYDRLLVVVLTLLPIVFCWLALFIWRQYKTAQYIKNLKWYLLEIKLPREILKSPQAMEIVLSALHQTPEGTWYTRLTEGTIRLWSSLEIVSIGGGIYFYVRVPEKIKNVVESAFYSQYPGIEITEADDYTKYVDYGHPESEWELEGFQFELNKEDPYPIKTYVDYGLDKNPKEEEKVDPLSSTLELLGSMKPGEQMWIQFLIMAAKDRFPKKGTWFGKTDWKGQAKELIDAKVATTTQEGNKDPNRLKPGDKKAIEAIERNITKLGFDCGFRSLYIAKKDVFDKLNFGAMASATKQYNSADLNGFKPGISTAIKFPWQDLTGKKAALKKYTMFDAYRRRSYFYPPYVYKPFIFNTEELATVYHLPGSVAQTPTLKRIESRRGEPPANIPL